MPRYVFHIHDGIEITSDPEGLEFPNDEAARRDAVRALCEVAMDEVPKDGDRQDICVHVVTNDGAPLFSARLDFRVDAVAKAPPSLPGRGQAPR